MGVSVCVLDYGSGNVKSVITMVRMITDDVVVSNAKEDVLRASHLILPGVGAFGAAMEKMHRLLPMDAMKDQVLNNGTPFLGICVGMQVLADEGHEFGVHSGLGWIRGTTEKINTSLRLPHIGWNNVRFIEGESLGAGLEADTDFYFVHSYAFAPADADSIIATTDYGEKFCSSVRRDNIFGVQFHPEKSQHAGKQLLANFLSVEAGSC